MAHFDNSKESFESVILIIGSVRIPVKFQTDGKEVVPVAFKEGYDVLRLIGHGQACYISSEYVEGEIFARWLKYHPNITKEELYFWIQSMAKQLGMLHKCRKMPCYKYVNPYSMIVTEEKELYFLDMESGSNERQLRIMQKRAVREAFLPPEESYYQKGSAELDIYGLGKTIQYLLAVSEPDPPLTRREEKKFQKILSRCLKRQSKQSYHNIEEIRKDIPEYHQKKKHRISRRKTLLLMTGCIIAILILFSVVSAKDEKNQERMTEKVQGATNEGTETGNLVDAQRDAQADAQAETEGRTQTKMTEEILAEEEVYMELALVYFLDLEDAGRGLSCLERICADYKPADDLGTILELFLTEETSRAPEDLKTHLESLAVHVEELEAATENKDSSEWEELTASYYRCLIRGYGLQEDPESSKQILDLGSKYLALAGDSEEQEEGTEEREEGTKEQEGDSEGQEKEGSREGQGQSGHGETSAARQTEAMIEVREYMAGAYEKLGETDKSAEMYERILELTTDDGKKEACYLRLADLYESCEEKEQALDACVRGIKGTEGSLELRLLHIRLLCSDSSVEREACAQTIQEYIRQMPEILEKEEFQKLQREYGIQVEGEKVWVGR